MVSASSNTCELPINTNLNMYTNMSQWIVPIIGTGVIGLGNSLVFVSNFTAMPHIAY